MLQTVQDLFTLIATGSGIYIAVAGLNAWRRETTGKRDIELCQNVIERFYEAEHKMNVLRSPMSYSQEGESRAKAENESEEEKNRRDTLFVPLARLNQQSEFWSDFFSYKFRMRALFGADAVAAFDKADEAHRSFRAAAIVRYQSLFHNPAGLGSESRMNFEKTIWGSSGKTDEIAEQMRSAIRDMEAICVPIVRSTRPSIRNWWKALSRRDR
ncbi:hypothetical protein CU102_12845 [Phyllobacterium brassicacearum]|uniref:Uncharacterized protein n=1 Tax=Phyllobacterium brassicacearum TaxID=314235 RepID=A0A2P7BQC4_9HYPH|nr:hypothetical protein [Phyllobacterium brassicacearum]PSH68639.1 hypothetical protein CU102_12845 [Phyllobacterium brassicacearum]TDQ24191.1 hypothetical protein DEV91_11569 [Phyllobacterium brassicacearum]